MTPAPRLDRPAYAPAPDRPLPRETEVVVIGGGVVGTVAALTLAEWGVPVVLCEKGRIAGEQSSRNWGWIRKQGRDLRELPLMLEAQALWRQLGQRVAGDIGLREKGVAYLALSEAEMAGHEAWHAASRGFQLDTQILGPAEADALVGQDARRFTGGIFTPSDMHADPALAVPAIAALAQAAGAHLFEMTAVRTLERAGGRISGVATEHGTIACQHVILAGGAWSRSFLENAGRGLPQLAVRAQVIRTERVDEIAPCPVGTSLASVRPRLDGGVNLARTGAARFDLIPAAFAHFRAFLPILRERWHILKPRVGREFFGALGRHRWGPDQMSPFETVRMFDPAPDPALNRSLLEKGAEVYPQLRGARVAASWGGMIDVMPDEIPVIGPMPGLDGLTLATGLSGHGFGLGPGVGRLAAELATGRPPVVDPAAFAYDRFGRS